MTNVCSDYDDEKNGLKRKTDKILTFCVKDIGTYVAVVSFFFTKNFVWQVCARLCE